MKIVVLGYYGFGNVGDELILSTLLGQIRGASPKSQVVVLSSDPTQTRAHHEASSVFRTNLLDIRSALKNCDLFILGGGGLIQDQTSLLSLVYYLGMLMLAHLGGARVVTYALGVESVSKAGSRWLVNRVFSYFVDLITVRDHESKELLLSMGIKKEIVYTLDPVFSKAFSFSRPVSKRSVLLIPRFPCPVNGISLFEEIGRQIKQSQSYSVEGTLFQPKREKQELFEGSRRIKEIEEWTWPLNSDNMINVVASSSFVVSARFHGLVMACLAGRPFLGVGDFHKVGRFCQAWGMPFLNWEADQTEVAQALQKLFTTGPNPKSNNLLEWQKKSQETIRYICPSN